MTGLSALIAGARPHYSWQLIALLKSCSFAVDVLARDQHFFRSQTAADLVLPAPDSSALIDSALELMSSKSYDWIIVGDNRCLRDLALRIDIPVESRLALAPVEAVGDLGHLHSKAGLARRLQQAGFPTPHTVICRSFTDVGPAVAQVGYPGIIKLDSSAAGRGVFRVRNWSDVAKLAPLLARRRCVVQPDLSGKEVSVNALFFHGHLAQLTVMEPLQRVTWGGEWTVMRATSSSMHPIIRAEVAELGRILGIHGFSNIAAIEDGQRRLYFEADTRPNVWSTCGAEIGDDPRSAVLQHFGTTPTRDDVLPRSSETHSSHFEYAYPPRLSPTERRDNAYNWRARFPNGLPLGL